MPRMEDAGNIVEESVEAMCNHKKPQKTIKTTKNHKNHKTTKNHKKPQKTIKTTKNHKIFFVLFLPSNLKFSRIKPVTTSFEP
jgi:FKBP-type peptidyl-prolyl cis-trans isomerase